jgi:hypothetical protein
MAAAAPRPLLNGRLRFLLAPVSVSSPAWQRPSAPSLLPQDNQCSSWVRAQPSGTTAEESQCARMTSYELLEGCPLYTTDLQIKPHVHQNPQRNIIVTLLPFDLMVLLFVLLERGSPSAQMRRLQQMALVINTLCEP